MTEKTHARDYLMELAEGKNTKGWIHERNGTGGQVTVPRLKCA